MKLITLMIAGILAGNMQLASAEDMANAPVAAQEPAPMIPPPPPPPAGMPSNPQQMMDKMPIQTDMPRTMMNTAPQAARVPEQMMRQMPDMPDQMMNAMPMPSGNMPMPMGGNMPMPGNMMGNNNGFQPPMMNGGMPRRGMGRGPQCDHSGPNRDCPFHNANNPNAPQNDRTDRRANREQRQQMMMQHRTQIDERLDRIEATLQQLLEAQKGAAAQ